MEAHQTAIVEIPEQYDRTGSSRYQVPTRPMLGFKSFDYAAITIAGVELLHRIRKGQLALHRLHLKDRAAPAIWNAVLAA
jgi:hypothetical protein